jgi:colicin import membrane protein
MIRTALLLALSTVMAAGCAALVRAGDNDAAAQLDEGAAAVSAQEFLRARGLLEPLFYTRPDGPIARQALLVLIAAELDNRNPDRRLWAAADMAARLLQLETLEPWAVPVAESYYLLAMELGAAEQRIAAAETARAQAQAEAAAARARLPETTRESVPARLGRITSERDQQRRRADQLEQQLAARDRELAETKQELERIKRTIRP